MSNTPPVIELKNIEDIHPHPDNAKVHPEAQIEKLARSISRMGWTQPIVIWKDGSIIAGHGRRLAAIKLGLAKVPVIVRADLTESEAAALRIADNKVVSDDYDMEKMQEALRGIAEIGEVDLLDIGINENELAFVMEDLLEEDTDSIVDDIAEGIESQQKENEDAIERVDQTAAPIADAFGFKRISLEQSRKIRFYMSQIEDETGKAGADALVEYFSNRLDR